MFVYKARPMSSLLSLWIMCT